MLRLDLGPVDGRGIVMQKIAQAEIDAALAAKRAAPHRVTPPARVAELASILARVPGNSCRDQRARILAALATGSISTHEMRVYLDIVQPGARMTELRDAGHEIIGTWAVFHTRDERPHRFMSYTLLPKA